MRNFFYFFCGVDVYLIGDCSEDEQNRYLALGVTVFLLSCLAIIFSSYALTTILVSVAKGALPQRVLEYTFAFALSLCWTFIVMNFYRLIISATGIGDGTSKITFAEFFTFIPKLVITVAMALVICVPMTIWILKSEIEHLPSQIQRTQINEFNKQVEAENSDKLLDFYIKQAEVRKQIELNKLQKNTLENNLIDNKTADTKASLEKFAVSDRQMNEELTSIDIAIKNIRMNVSRVEESNSTALINSTTLIADLGRVLDRHKPLFIFTTFFMMLIHMLPLFVRTIWVKGSYEFIVLFQEDIVLKKYGIVKNYKKFKEGYVAKFSIPELILSKEKEKHFKTRKQSILMLSDWKRRGIKLLKGS